MKSNDFWNDELCGSLSPTSPTHASAHAHSHSVIHGVHSSHSHSSHAHTSHSSPSDVEGHSHINSLNPLEQHEQLHAVHPSVAVVVALHDCAPDILVVHGGTDSHGQAEVPVGEEELLAL